jgi:hypothetical protein
MLRCSNWFAVRLFMIRRRFNGLNSFARAGWAVAKTSLLRESDCEHPELDVSPTARRNYADDSPRIRSDASGPRLGPECRFAKAVIAEHRRTNLPPEESRPRLRRIAVGLADFLQTDQTRRIGETGHSQGPRALFVAILFAIAKGWTWAFFRVCICAHAAAVNKDHFSSCWNHEIGLAGSSVQ